MCQKFTKTCRTWTSELLSFILLHKNPVAPSPNYVAEILGFEDQNRNGATCLPPDSYVRKKVKKERKVRKKDRGPNPVSFLSISGKVDFLQTATFAFI